MKKIFKTDWNLKLLYKSTTDPQIEKDLVKFEKELKNFNKKYGGSIDFTNSAQKLKTALDEYSKLDEYSGAINPYLYFRWHKDSGNSDPVIQKRLTQIETRMNVASNNIVFFTIAIKKIDKKKQSQLLKAPVLKEYKYLLRLLFDASKHTLTELETKILNIKNQTSSSMWITGVDRALSSKTISYNGKQISIGEASNISHDLSTNQRRKLFSEMMKTSATLSEFAESEINAVYTDKKINDDLHKYKKPYSQTIKDYENDEKDIEEFVALITNNFKISHRFFNLKKKLMKLSHLKYADRGARIGKINRKYDLDSGLKILNDSFNKIDPKYGDILNSFLKNGQIDTFPKKGKTSGAYCWGAHTAPTMVLLNYVNNFDSVNTFAHEMGHAFHTEFSKSQPVQYENYTMSVAETASTFFENFVFEEVFETLNDKEKIIALHDKIQSTVSTIFRQIACFNFENEMHMKVREQGYVPIDEILETMNKHMSSYLGPAFKLDREDGYFFIQWSHIRRPFYVYAYAFGELISSALYESYKKDPVYINKVETFLSAGGSMSPKDIFKKAGIDISDINFFKKGLKKIEKDIDLLEKLAN